jgi:DNA-binding transcriptional ArsR family regulator
MTPCTKCGGQPFYDAYEREHRCLQCGMPVVREPPVYLPLSYDRPGRRRQAVSNAAKVRAYVEACEGRTATQIAIALEVDQAEVRKVLAGLRDQGVVVRRGEGKPFRWYRVDIEEAAS